jgi:hypothetical protein
VSDSNPIAVLERTSLTVYEADIFNCPRQPGPASMARSCFQSVRGQIGVVIRGMDRVLIDANTFPCTRFIFRALRFNPSGSLSSGAS